MTTINFPASPTLSQVFTAAGKTYVWNGSYWVATTESYQPLDADLTAIAALAGTSGLLKKTAANTWALEGSYYADANGKLITAASSLTSAGLNLPHGTAPTTPANGDLWTTTAGIYARINGTTVGPLGAGGGGGASITVSATAPASPTAGSLWWDSQFGNLKIYYNDGDNSQWVNAAQGTIGPAATVAVGTVTTGAAGSTVTVTNSGTSGAAVLDFTIPRGDTGATGTAATVAAGTTTTGAAGTSASVTNSGTSSAAVFNFTIPRGDTGTAGAAATIAVGTTTTGAAGTNAAVTNSGTSSAAVFDFTVPRGATGPMGPKAITIVGPVNGDNLVMFYTNTALTLSACRAVLDGTTPSISYTINSGADRTVTSTTHVTATSVTSTTTGTAATISNASIPAGRWVWIVITALSGTVAEVAVSLDFA